MPRRAAFPGALKLEDIASHDKDVKDGLRLLFGPTNPSYEVRFVGKSRRDVEQELRRRLDESDLRSSFFLLTSLEATFRIDFDRRCEKRLKDPVSRHFRAIRRNPRLPPRLDEDILEGWKRHEAAHGKTIGELRGAFKYRHWLAHGRYWEPKLGRKYDFEGLRLLAEAVISALPFTN